MATDAAADGMDGVTLAAALDSSPSEIGRAHV